MIISHKYQFIFIKTRKTAGTSIEISLSRYCGEDDVITPISPDDESVRSELGVYPRNYQGYSNPFRGFDGDLPSLRRSLAHFAKREKYYNHIPARIVKKTIGQRIWDSYYKFTVERHPCDRLISLYFWKNQNGEFRSFKEFIETSNSDLSNCSLYSIDGSVAVDAVLDFKRLDSELAETCRLLALPFDGWLPRAKGTVRKDTRKYQEIMDERVIEQIETRFAREIQFIGYRRHPD